MVWQSFIQNDFYPYVISIISSTLLVFKLLKHCCIDGLNEVDHSEPATSLKNQAAGLLQAVKYLKGFYILQHFFVYSFTTIILTLSLFVTAPLVVINVLVILLELLIGG